MGAGASSGARASAQSSAGPSDVARAMARARQAVAVLASPTLRAALVGDGELDDRTRAAVDAFDWVDEHGPDRALLGSTARTLQLLQAPAAALEFDRIARMPHAEAERVPLSLRIVGIVGDRLGRTRPLTEPVLNAAIAMFAEDVAVVRRDAVDQGLLERTEDGASYRFVG
ncbi:DUF2087 domain-containing protein [Curtobacterium sp. 458]|uniref:DUF2087 domain-containing protein n=1 Tax=Curtobacterium sp. 458 TaxID=3050069 RepID=UPI0025B2C402|nr:DUF2087 domain-containing protein [Curtobacterium sp. 458]WJX98617.1 DUF2087 domain-containing protein [Curtobacterium sp. 458]